MRLPKSQLLPRYGQVALHFELCKSKLDGCGPNMYMCRCLRIIKAKTVATFVIEFLSLRVQRVLAVV